MPGTSPTLVVLREIRDEIEGTHARLEAVERRLGTVERGQAELETRLATELVGVAMAVIEVRDLLRERLGVRDRV